MASTRRNGQLSSCEPCRKSKLRCDHSSPICTRCVRRGKSDSCVYHPAPLTRPRNLRRSHKGGRTSSKVSVRSFNYEYDWVNLAPSAAVHRVGPDRPNGAKRSLSNPGFLGLTSYSGVFPEHAGLIEPSIGQPTDLLTQDQTLSALATTLVGSRQLELGAQVLSLLDHLSLYEEILEKRFAVFEGWIIGPPIVRNIIKSLRDLSENRARGPGDGESGLLGLSKILFKNTAAPIETNPTMMAPDYVSVAAPRWDTISFLLSAMGTATYQIPQDDKLLQQDTLPGGDREGLRRLAVAASDVCLQFCDSLGIISDPMCWATIQQTAFYSHMHGSGDYRTWKKLGDITTIVFALGLHQSEVDENAPFFLAEIRKRAMAGAYIFDKEIATFLGRPPRILWRHCNIQYPLDLSYDEVVAEPTVRNAIIQKLDSNGWNIEGSRDKGALPRILLMLAPVREEILELSLNYEVDGLEGRVQKLSEESSLMRQKLPSFLNWDPDKGDMTLLSVHLEFLYQDLLLFKTLFKRTGKGEEYLVKTSSEILTVLLDMVSRLARSGKVVSSLIWELCYIGVPAAGVLSSQLLRRSRLQPSQPTSLLSSAQFPRSEIIQNLSVFAAHLGGLLWQENGNYEVYKKGQMAIRDVLDRVLSDDPARASTDAGVSPDLEVDFMEFWDSFDWEQEIRFSFS
ncbi:hypothetical protein BDV23DRAFT_192857 [Aspergillus alliaceus]|uniref:Zn(2)-C6 fungal-type domain-containing protein n=1 Tax=Petromyces alliaceus TaxID=209559 RepID=A0A5N7CCE4_PETAA|nr:hypothetical protein BDV23DRAFT_192857 [Aspergillus alliaceus]